MAIIHEATREVAMKIVYHGAGMCGKTTSLQYLHEHLPAHQHGRMVSLETPTERTLYFDFLPILGEARGYTFRHVLFTTPGQDYYEASRRLVLKGADGIVLVVDSQAGRMADNLSAFAALERDLGTGMGGAPRVLQYNKRDLPDVLGLDEAERRFNPSGLPSFPAAARSGQGVYETFLTVAKLALQRLLAPVPAGDAGPALVIAAADRDRFGAILGLLCRDAGGSGALVVDEGCGILAQAGAMPPGDRESLGALLACTFTAAQELSWNLSGTRFEGIVQEGTRGHLVAVRVDDARLLVLLTGGRPDHPDVWRAIGAAEAACRERLREIQAASPVRLDRFAAQFGQAARATAMAEGAR